MKKSKKFLKVLSATAIAAIMATTMASTAAFAADTSTLTVPATTIGSTSESVDTAVAYKVAVKNSETAQGWAWNTSVVGTTGLPDISNTDISTYTSAQAKDLAMKIKNNLVESASSTALNNDGSGNLVATGLDEGYYLVVLTPKTNATTTYQPILIQKDANTNAEVTLVKAATIDVDKTITGVESMLDGSTELGGATYNSNAAQVNIGQKVDFQIKTQIPTYSPEILSNSTKLADFQKFTITDTPTNITLTSKDDIKVYVTANDTYSDSDLVAEDKDNTFELTLTGNVATVTFAPKYILEDVVGNDGIADNANKNVFVTLKGTLDNGAATVIEGEGNPNNAKITFSNDYSTGSGSNEKTDTVKVFTTQFEITKKNSEDTVLPGAEFVVYQTSDNTSAGTKIGYLKTDGSISTTEVKLTSDENGKVLLKGISAGTYFVQETKAPDGYKLEDGVKTLVINANGNIDQNKLLTDTENVNATSVVFKNGSGDIGSAASYPDVGFIATIINTPGQTLPGTGGVGTTMFTIGGIGLVLVAGAMLTIYIKKRKTSEEE